MSTIDLTLAPEEAAKLAEVAAREGVSPEALAAAAVRARLASEAEIEAMILAGFKEIDDGASRSLEDFEAEMDAFMAALDSGA